jgi:hypothetical protein
MRPAIRPNPDALSQAGRRWTAVLLASAASVLAVPRLPTGTSRPATSGRAVLPLTFEENRGQAPGETRFLARSGGMTVHLGPAAATYVLAGAPEQEPPSQRRAIGSARPPSPEVVRLELLGARRDAPSRGERPLPGRISYLHGPDAGRWITGVPLHSQVRFQSVYPGVDLVYHGRNGGLEYDFVVAPWADPSAIRMSVSGPHPTTVDPRGDLLIRTRVGLLRHHRPLVYQEAGPHRRPVDGAYRLARLASGETSVAFALGAYDRSRPLVIDPRLEFATYLGGAGQDAAGAIASGPDGSLVVAGSSFSPGLPTTHRALQAAPAAGNGANAEGFVARLDPTGSTLLACTYLGGSGADEVRGVAVDGAGRIFVTGATTSTDFPVTSSSLPRGSAPNAGFVCCIAPNLNVFGYSTYLPAEGLGCVAEQIATDVNGNTTVIGTAAAGFPTTARALQPTLASAAGAIVVRLPPAGPPFTWATYLGGSSPAGVVTGRAVVVDESGCPSIAGTVANDALPTTPMAVQPGLAGTQDGFVARLDATGTEIEACTLIGGNGDQDTPNAIAVDGDKGFHLVGSTTSSDFPTTPGAFQGSRPALHPRDPSGTYTVIRGDASQVRYGTYLGGDHGSMATAVAVLEAPEGTRTVVAGECRDATGFPRLEPISAVFPSGPQWFAAQFGAPNFTPRFCSLLGLGARPGVLYRVRPGEPNQTTATVTGLARRLPTTPGAFQTVPGGDADAGLLQLDMGSLIDFAPVHITAAEASGGGIRLVLESAPPSSSEVLALERRQVQPPPPGPPGALPSFAEVTRLPAASREWFDQQVAGPAVYEYRARRGNGSLFSGYSANASVTFAAAAGAGKLTPTPARVAFGVVRGRRSLRRTVTLANSSAAPITGVVGPLSSPLAVTSGEGFFTLAPRKRHSVVIELAPQAAGAVGQELTVTSDAARTPRFRIPVTAQVR